MLGRGNGNVSRRKFRRILHLVFTVVILVCAGLHSPVAYPQVKSGDSAKTKGRKNETVIMLTSKQEIAAVLSTFNSKEPLQVELIRRIRPGLYHIELKSHSRGCYALRAEVSGAESKMDVDFQAREFDCGSH